jgi:hypothetical protein
MNEAPKIELIEGEIASVSLKPGDRLVVMSETTLSLDAITQMQESLKRWAPDYPVLVMDNGLRLGVIRAE